MSFLAFDLGAESGRAILGRLRSGLLEVSEIYRFPNEPVQYRGELHWDILRLWQEMKKALESPSLPKLESIGIDTWGVDYALLGEIAGIRFEEVRIMGGGSRNHLLNQFTADATGRTVVAGPAEATALGNIAMQMLATGAVSSLAEARQIIDRSFPVERFKPSAADRSSPRERLSDSLDRIFAEKIDPAVHLDAVESKLFGIGAESYTVGSHEFYLGYAVSRQKLLCLDSGHFHPTEMISEKISSILMFCPQLLLHVSRPVRWDSDHVVILDDELQAIAKELIRSGQIERIHIGLDFFDASINRIAAWVIGNRNMLKALLIALLEPFEELRKLELGMDYTRRLMSLSIVSCAARRGGLAD